MASEISSSARSAGLINVRKSLRCHLSCGAWYALALLLGTALGIAIALLGGFVIYGVIKATIGLRLDPEEEFRGADLTIHNIAANPEYDR